MVGKHYRLLDSGLNNYDRLRSLNSRVTAFCAGDAPVLLIDPMGQALRSLEKRGVPIYFFGDPDLTKNLEDQFIVAIRGVKNTLTLQQVEALKPRKLIFITSLEDPDFTQDIHDALTVINVRHCRIPGSDEDTHLDAVLSPPYIRYLRS